MSGLELLPFFCPIEPSLHPRVDALENRAVSWLEKHDIPAGSDGRRRLVSTRSAEFYGRITPYGDEHRMQPAVNWVYWGFALDDARCDERSVNGRPGPFVAMASRLMRAIRSSDPDPLTADPFVAALADVAAELRHRATSTQYRRWVNANQSWLHGVAWQMSNTESGNFPDLGDYLAMRLDSCGGEPPSAMLEIVDGDEVPAREMDSAPVTAITEAARMVAALDNDLVSFQKEMLLDQADQNVINVIARQHRCSRQDALVQATAIRDRVMSLFLRLDATIRPAASAQLRNYLDGLSRLIRGNIDWSLRVARYHELNGVGDAPRNVPGQHPGISDRPSDDNPDPLPVPTLRWWWEQLT